MVLWFVLRYLHAVSCFALFVDFVVCWFLSLSLSLSLFLFLFRSPLLSLSLSFFLSFFLSLSLSLLLLLQVLYDFAEYIAPIKALSVVPSHIPLSDLTPYLVSTHMPTLTRSRSRTLTHTYTHVDMSTCVWF